MNTKTLFSLIAIFIMSLLTGCATKVPLVAGLDMPDMIKTEAYYKKNINRVVAKADAGDAAAQYELSWLYTGSSGISRDIKVSNFWLEKSAALDYMVAVSALSGRRFQYAKYGYPKDFVLARKLLDKAYQIYLSQPKSAWSQYSINMLSSGFTLGSDYAEDKEQLQSYLCTSLKIDGTDSNHIYVLNKALKDNKIRCD